MLSYADLARAARILNWKTQIKMKEVVNRMLESELDKRVSR
jgi:GDP-D-mannose dehydratase